MDTVSYDGKYATGFSYERLTRYMPGYGYVHSDEPFLMKMLLNRQDYSLPILKKVKEDQSFR